MYLNKILVTTDFSDLASSAYGLALHEAVLTSSEITLIHVLEQPIFPTDYNIYLPGSNYTLEINENLSKAAKEKLDQIAKKYFKNIKTDTVVITSLGEPSEEIIRFARDNHFGLIISANQGKGALKHFLLGSTTERIARISRKPVLISHSAKINDSAPSEATGIYKNIIVTTDFSRHSELAFRYAAYEAKLNKAKVTLLHVAEFLIAPELLNIRDFSDNFDANALQDKYYKDSSEQLVNYAKEHFPLANIETKVIEKSISTSNTIINYIKNNCCDLVVIATHGKDRTTYFLGGNAEKIIRQVSCPVLLIPV